MAFDPEIKVFCRSKYGLFKVTAKNILTATNSYSSHLKPYNTFYAPLHVFTVVSKPLNKEQLDSLKSWKNTRTGWFVPLSLFFPSSFLPRFFNTITSHHVILILARYTLHHILWACRLTADNRIAIATGDVYYVNKDRLHDTSNRDSSYGKLENALRTFFPGITLEVDARWEGVIAVTLSDLPCIGTLDSKHPNVFHALAYCGHGVPASNYSGIVIKDLFLKNQASKYLSSDFRFIGHGQRPFPPVPKGVARP
jgi:glycine/D-amino acid oxidase-like deaminating enzyme